MEYSGSIDEVPTSVDPRHPLCSYLSHSSSVIRLFLQRNALVELHGQSIRESKVPNTLVEPQAKLKCSGLFSRHAGDFSLALLNVKSGVCMIFSAHTLLPVSTIVDVKSMKVGDFSNKGYRELKLLLQTGKAHEMNENITANSRPEVSAVLKSELESTRESVRQAKLQILNVDQEIAKLCSKLGSANAIGDKELVKNVIGRCGNGDSPMDVPQESSKQDWAVTFNEPVLFQNWALLSMNVQGVVQQELSVHVIAPEHRSYLIIKDFADRHQWTIGIQASLTVSCPDQFQGCLRWQAGSNFHQQLFEIPHPKIHTIKRENSALRMALPLFKSFQIGVASRCDTTVKDALHALGLSELSKNLFEAKGDRFQGPVFVKITHPNDSQLHVFGTDLSFRLLLRRFHEEWSENLVILPLSAWKYLQEGQKKVYEDNVRSLIAACQGVVDLSPVQNSSSCAVDGSSMEELDKDYFQLRQNTTQVKMKSVCVVAKHFDGVLRHINSLTIVNKVD